MKKWVLTIASASSAPFRAVERVGRGFIPGRRRRGMNPPATGETRLQPFRGSRIGRNDDQGQEMFDVADELQYSNPFNKGLRPYQKGLKEDVSC